MKIYGFNATIQKEGKLGYVGRIKELHANTQAKTMKELVQNLKEAAKLMLFDVLENERLYSKATVDRAKAIVMEALA